MQLIKDIFYSLCLMMIRGAAMLDSKLVVVEVPLTTLQPQGVFVMIKCGNVHLNF